MARATARTSVPASGSSSFQQRQQQAHVQVAAARLANHMLRSMVNARGYAGAELGRRTENIHASSGGANAELAGGLGRLRARSRQLVRDNPHAGAVINSFCDAIVGTGFVVTPQTGSDRFDRQYRAAWDEFQQSCDVTGQLTFDGMQWLACRAMLESGEVLTRFHTPQQSGRFPLELQLLEGDFIDSGRLQPSGNDNRRVVQGVEVNQFGRPLGYWLYNSHPGEAFTGFGSFGHDSNFVPAEQCLNLFELARPGQLRGVPHLAPLIMLFNDLADYDEAEGMRKKIEACLAAFVTQEDAEEGAELGDGSGPGMPDAAGSDDLRVETFHPAMVTYLRPGEKVTIADPKPSAGYEAYKRSKLRDAAAGAGVTYQMISGDLSDTNYSSYRAGLIVHRAAADRKRWLTFVPRWLSPVYRRFAERAFIAGRVGRLDYGVEYTAPAYQSVNPEVDAKTDIMLIRAGLQSQQEALAARGLDYHKIMQQLVDAASLQAASGLVLDTNAALLSGSGVAHSQPPGQPADNPQN